MMGIRHVLTGGLAVGLLACAAVSANAQQQDVAIIGYAEGVCTLGQLTRGEGQFSNFDTPAGSVFTITALTDPVTLTTRAASVTLTVDAMCNATHRVTLASDNNGLWRQNAGSQPAGFASGVPYRASMTWADQTQPFAADAGSRQSVERSLLVDSAATGAISIEFEIQAGATNAGVGTPLIAGEYSDVLRVTVEPQ